MGLPCDNIELIKRSIVLIIKNRVEVETDFQRMNDSVGGEILGEEMSGTRWDYLMDALGSVTGTVTAAVAVENSYRYKAYGDQLSKTGQAMPQSSYGMESQDTGRPVLGL